MILIGLPISYEDNGVDTIGMDYSTMTPLLVEAANAMRAEYQEKFDTQEARIQSLESELTQIKSLSSAQAKAQVGEE